MKISALLGLTIFACGCDSIQFTPYAGKQGTWPTAPAAFVKTIRGIQIYHDSFPDRPYIVLGQSTGENQDDKDFAQHARNHGADAVLLFQEYEKSLGTKYESGITLGNSSAHWTTPGTTRHLTAQTAHLIKFVDPPPNKQNQ